MSKCALPYLEKTRGNVLQISSTASITPLQTEPYYCSFKAAIDQLTRCFALEYGPKGVRFNCLKLVFQYFFFKYKLYLVPGLLKQKLLDVWEFRTLINLM